MSGPAVDVHVSEAAVANKPKPWDLSSPETAVRSYLDWISYVYRVGNSDVARGVMTADEMVRVDAYNQYNIQQKRLVQQKVDEISFGKISIKNETTATVPADESWTYSYLSIDKGNAPVQGPLKAEYKTVYTVVKSKDGMWRVAKVKATPNGTVK